MAELKFAQLSSGASDDLVQAPEIARTKLTRYVIDTTLGQATYDGERQSYLTDMPGYAPTGRSYSEPTGWQIDEAVRTQTAPAFDRATQALSLHGNCSTISPVSCWKRKR